MLSLDRFETEISPVIVQRGKEYWGRNHVLWLDKIDHDTYEAEVEGSENYQIQLTLADGIVTEYECDCPFDQGPVCKHIVAVLFALRKELGQAGWTGPDDLVMEKVRQALADATREELEDYLAELCKTDAMTRQKFLLRFNPPVSIQSPALTKTDFMAEIKKILRPEKRGRYYEDYEDFSDQADQIDELLAAAKTQATPERIGTAVGLALAVIEIIVPSDDFYDEEDSLASCVANAIELLDTVAHLATLDQLQMDEYFLAIFRVIGQLGRDPRRFDLAQSAILFVSGESSEQRLADYLQAVTGNRGDEERAAQLHHRLLMARGKLAQAQRLADASVHWPSFRRMALEANAVAGDWEKVKRLALAGTMADHEQPGLVNEWLRWLLRTAQATSDQAGILHFASELFSHSWGDMDYYRIIKEQYPPEEWPDQVDKILVGIKEQGRVFAGYHLSVGKVLIEEKRWPQLWQLLLEHPKLEIIQHYDPYLAPHFADQLIDLYAKELAVYVDKNLGREYYQTACQILQRMRKLGGADQVSRLVSEFRQLYKRRSALLQELAKL
jgi:hypothetical protein